MFLRKVSVTFIYTLIGMLFVEPAHDRESHMNTFSIKILKTPFRFNAATISLSGKGGWLDKDPLH